jgi:hypothetical protein
MVMEDFEDGLPTRFGEKEAKEEVAQGEQHEPEAVWQGRGPPRRVDVMGKDRAFHDGGGLCSPGRWARAVRKLPAGAIRSFFEELKKNLREFWKEQSGGQEDLYTLALRIAKGQFKEMPFTQPFLDSSLELMKKWMGLKESDMNIAEGQCFRLTALTKILKQVGALRLASMRLWRGRLLSMRRS